MPLIKIKDLSTSYTIKKSDIMVLKGLNVTFESNKIHIILGSSGCGKTTLLKCLLGLADYRGDISIDDISINNVPTKERKFGYVSQEFALYPHWDLFKIIAYPLKIMGVAIDEIRERVQAIAKELDIEDILSRKPKQISIGQAQRVALARAFIKRPSVILLDEPLSNIDLEHRFIFKNYIKTLIKNYGSTAIYVTHDLKEATSLGDYIYLLDDGKIIFKDTPTGLLESLDPRVKEFIKTLPHD